MAGRILVTGSSGFVGGALGARLRAAGWAVTGLSRGAPRDGACDVHVAHDLTRPLPADLGRFDAIVHCAALASPWASPAAYEAANVTGLRHMLEFAAASGAGRFVFLSSTSVHYRFGDSVGMSGEEPWPERPINLYAASKRRGEAMVRASDLPWTIVRPRAVFGPGDTVVFPRILQAASRGMLPRLRRSDGVRPVADLLYIDNLTWFLQRVLELGAPGVFDISDGRPREIEAMLDEVLTTLGLPLPAREVNVGTAMALARALEFVSATFQGWKEPPVTRFGVSSLAYSRTVDVTRARALAGEPPVSQEEGMAAFVAWQKAQAA